MWTVALQMVLLFLFTAIVISPLLSLFFIKSGYWVSYLGINIFFFVVIIVILMPIFMWVYQTETLPRIEKMDVKYEEMKDTLPKGNSKEKILATTWQSGSKQQRSINFLINNYNNKDFEGVIKIQGYYEGKLINTEKVKISLLANEKGYEDYVSGSDFWETRHMWRNLEIKYEIEGKFK